MNLEICNNMHLSYIFQEFIIGVILSAQNLDPLLNLTFCKPSLTFRDWSFADLSAHSKSALSVWAPITALWLMSKLEKCSLFFCLQVRLPYSVWFSSSHFTALSSFRLFVVHAHSIVFCVFFLFCISPSPRKRWLLNMYSSYFSTISSVMALHRWVCLLTALESSVSRTMPTCFYTSDIKA